MYVQSEICVSSLKNEFTSAAFRRSFYFAFLVRKQNFLFLN